MATLRTNLIEHLLRETFVGLKIYTSGTTTAKINSLDYQPLTGEVFIVCDDGNNYIINIYEDYDFDINKYTNTKIIPTKGKIKNKDKT